MSYNFLLLSLHCYKLQAARLQAELEAAESRLQRKDDRHIEVLKIQREAAMAQRNSSIEGMKDAGRRTLLLLWKAMTFTVWD